MKTKLTILSTFVLMALLILLGTINVCAAPPSPMTQTLSQPSGETFAANLHGDEWFHWMETDTGFVVVKENDNYWYYAVLDDGTITSSDAKYAIDASPAGALTGKNVTETKAAEKAARVKRSVFNLTEQQASLSPAVESEQKALALLVGFSDVSISYEQSWYSRLFSVNSNSVNNYFRSVSGNKISLSPVSESYGTQNDGIIKVSLPYNHPNTAGSTSVLPNVRIVQEALCAADSYIDFAELDANNDGTIQSTEMHLIVIVAGYEYAYDGGQSSPSIWGHQYTAPVQLDGVTVGSVYMQEGEKHGNHMATIGIFCHELGHSLGLPDLYDCDGTSLGIGEFSLMGSGNWGRDTSSDYYGSSPTRLDAWSLQKLGVYSPKTAIQGINSISSADGANGYEMYKIATPNPKEYFLIENRQFSGQDIALKNYAASGATGGLAIWHIDEYVGDAVGWYAPNDNESHKAVDLEEADHASGSKLDNNNSSDHNSLFRANSSVPNSFSATSVPSNLMYNGTDPGFTITVSSPAGGVMYFDMVYDNLVLPKLLSLSLTADGEEYNIVPDFSSEVVDYSAEVPHDVSSITINATANEAGAEIDGLGTKLLSIGNNNFIITVQNAAGTAYTQYSVDVYRAEASSLSGVVFPDVYEINADNDRAYIYGVVDVSMLSAEVTLSTYFHINPNASAENDRFISPDISIQNTSTMPVEVTAVSMEATGEAPKIVDADKYTSQQWSELNKAETRENISLGFTGAKTGDFFFAAEGSQAEEALGTLNANETMNLGMQAKFGLSWPQARSFKYEAVFSLALKD